jgi:hypothetical protein
MAGCYKASHRYSEDTRQWAIDRNGEKINDAVERREMTRTLYQRRRMGKALPSPAGVQEGQVSGRAAPRIDLATRWILIPWSSALSTSWAFTVGLSTAAIITTIITGTPVNAKKPGRFYTSRLVLPMYRPRDQTRPGAEWQRAACLLAHMLRQ